MAANLQYVPPMRESQSLTSSLSVPLALSSAILVVLLAVATSPSVMPRQRGPLTSTDAPSLHHDIQGVVVPRADNPTISWHSVSAPATPQLHRTPNPLPPHSLSSQRSDAVASGTLSGGETSMSLQTVDGSRSLQWVSDQPISVSVWDGTCSIDSTNHIVTNTQPTPCTLELQSDVFTAWQFFALA